MKCGKLGDGVKGRSAAVSQTSRSNAKPARRASFANHRMTQARLRLAFSTVALLSRSTRGRHGLDGKDIPQHALPA
jgi:hypothetical protein